MLVNKFAFLNSNLKNFYKKVKKKLKIVNNNKHKEIINQANKIKSRYLIKVTSYKTKDNQNEHEVESVNESTLPQTTLIADMKKSKMVKIVIKMLIYLTATQTNKQRNEN